MLRKVRLPWVTRELGVVARRRSVAHLGHWALGSEIWSHDLRRVMPGLGVLVCHHDGAVCWGRETICSTRLVGCHMSCVREEGLASGTRVHHLTWHTGLH